MSDDKTWPEWTDVLGQTYRPGDHVAIAIINGRSPQLVIGEVLRINRINSKGEAIVHGRFNRETKKYERFPSCTVRVQPKIDARGFWRDSGDNSARAVTYQIPENIIRIELKETTSS